MTNINVCVVVLCVSVSVYSVCLLMCPSVLVLVKDPRSAPASGLHLLCSVSPADFLGPDTNPRESGERFMSGSLLSGSQCTKTEKDIKRVQSDAAHLNTSK